MIFLNAENEKSLISQTVRDSDFDEICDPQGIFRVYWRLFSKFTFPPFEAVLLNFSVKHKNVFISEMYLSSFGDVSNCVLAEITFSFDG